MFYCRVNLIWPGILFAPAVNECRWSESTPIDTNSMWLAHKPSVMAIPLANESSRSQYLYNALLRMILRLDPEGSHAPV